MNRILSQADQFPDRTAAVKRAIDLVPLAERVQNAATNKRSDRVDWRNAVDEDRPFTDEEHRQRRHLLELAGGITGAVIQPGDTGSGGPMFDAVDRDSLFGPVIDPPAVPPTNISDATAVPNADFRAQVETGTGNGGQVPPPEPGGVAGEGSSTPKFSSTPRTPASPPSLGGPHVDISDADRMTQVTQAKCG
jgi:hypothetical protein